MFEGVHTGLGKRVAIKVLHEHLTTDAEMRARFVREGRLAARLEHPNVVGILDVGVEGDTAYLVMELLSGQDGAAFLRDRKRLSVPDALDLLLPVAASLAFAHDRGVVHRDLKPANLFLARDRHGEAHPKIVDFGLSKLVSATVETAPPHRTRHRHRDAAVHVPGADLRDAPRGREGRPVRARCHRLRGRDWAHSPFEDDSFYALLEKVRHASMPLPSERVARVAGWSFDLAVMRAFARDPEARYPDVRAFGRALAAAGCPANRRNLWERDFGDARGARQSFRPRPPLWSSP